jgi:hypothetical protein
VCRARFRLKKCALVEGSRRLAATPAALWQWDPIGVNEAFPWSYDEYDNYAGPIVTQLGSGADAMEIARYLDRVATVNMGLGVSAGRSETGPSSDLVDLAQRIVDWYPSSIEWWRSWSR